MAKIEAICTSPAKGEPKSPTPSAVFRAEVGIEGDGHAGPGHRQVSILAAEDIQTVARKLPAVQPGAFAENLVVSGVDLPALGLGSRLRVGEAVELSVTQIGKVCHDPCRIQRLTGDCIMPRAGVFCRVVAGGQARAGDPVEVLEAIPRDVFQAVVLTVSDKASVGQRADTAGPAVAKRLIDALGAHVYRAEIVPDDQRLIAERLRHYCDGHGIDLIVTVGGTGFAPRDVTPEATRAVIQRPTPGLDEAMRAASLAKTAHGILSRGVSGIRGSTLIVNLPGSPRAATENLAVILRALPHGLAKLRGDPADCATPGDEDGHAR